MPYVRCDVNCKPKTPQPGHYDVSQQESCLVYENYNLDYVRTDVNCQETTQPDLLNGWNGDYIRVKTDGQKVTGVSQVMVEQTIYQPTDVNCDPISFVCFNEPPAVGIVLDTDSTPIIYITPDTYDDNIFFAAEQYADYFLEFEGDRGRIEPEPKTLIDPNVLISF